jgi:hypothetical protein
MEQMVRIPNQNWDRICGGLAPRGPSEHQRQYNGRGRHVGIAILAGRKAVCNMVRETGTSYGISTPCLLKDCLPPASSLNFPLSIGRSNSGRPGRFLETCRDAATRCRLGAFRSQSACVSSPATAARHLPRGGVPSRRQATEKFSSLTIWHPSKILRHGRPEVHLLLCVYEASVLADGICASGISVISSLVRV